jgi:hypothetical protein
LLVRDIYSPARNTVARTKMLYTDQRGGEEGSLRMISSLLTTKATLLWSIGGQHVTVVGDPE